MHGLDHLRALAITLVFLFHYQVYYGIPKSVIPQYIDPIIQFGWSGVDLFFVLSGYLIASKVFSGVQKYGQVNLIAFYFNRALRIFPAFFGAVAIYFAFPELQEGRALQPIWRFLTFTQNLPIDLYANTFSHAWSLCVEEHFYIVFPLLIMILISTRTMGFGIGVVLALILFGLVIRYVSWSELVDPNVGRQRLGSALKYIYYPSYARLDGLVAGVSLAAIANYYPNLWKRIIAHGWIAFATGVALLILSFHVFGETVLSAQFSTWSAALFGFPLVSLGYAFFVIASVSPGFFLSYGSLQATKFLAALAFTIYLTHKMTNHWVNTNLPDNIVLSPEQTFFAALLAAILSALLLHLAVEKPLLLLRDWITSLFAANPSEKP